MFLSHKLLQDPRIAPEKLCDKLSFVHGQIFALQNLLAVAVNSNASAHLDGAGAGVQRSETWKLDTKVRNMGDNHLHLVIGPK